MYGLSCEFSPLSIRFHRNPRGIVRDKSRNTTTRRNAFETGSSQIQFPDSARQRIFPVFAVSGKVREARKAGGPLRSSRPQARPPFNRASCAREKGTADCFTRRTFRCALCIRIIIVDFGTIHDAIRIINQKGESNL